VALLQLVMGLAMKEKICARIVYVVGVDVSTPYIPNTFYVPRLLSNMGIYGSRTLKPTKVFGTAPGPHL